MSGGTTFGNCKEHGDYCGSSCPFCQIKALKERIGEINKILIAITEGRILELNTINNLEEVLRELWKRFYTHLKLGHKNITIMGEEFIEKLGGKKD